MGCDRSGDRHRVDGDLRHHGYVSEGPVDGAVDVGAPSWRRKNCMKFDIFIIGAGFSGSVAAERLADAGYSVLVIDKREHIGGNAFDEPDQHGVMIHRYGPHIFHTNAERVAEYLSRFTEW